jgi:Tol biopolymer transport system component
VLECPGPLSITVFRNDSSFGIEWSHAVERLAFNKKTSDGYENLFVSLPDGTGEHSLTYKNPAVPGRHACSPVWTPAGDYLVFSAEKARHSGSSTDAMCGFGAYSDIWVITADGQRAWQLTSVPNDYDHGDMIPRLSRDGKRLLWTERIAGPSLLRTAEAFGAWVLKVGDFLFVDGTPRLTNVRELAVGPRGFYEGGDFTPDGSGVIFTSSLATGNAWKSQIFVVDLTSGKLTQLTSADYNEHPRYTPDGLRIVWMSSTEARLKGTDWWTMDADGSHKRRLTRFEDPTSPQSSGDAVYPGTVAWDPSGRWFYGDIETSLVKQTYTAVRVVCP